MCSVGRSSVTRMSRSCIRILPWRSRAIPAVSVHASPDEGLAGPMRRGTRRWSHKGNGPGSARGGRSRTRQRANPSIANSLPIPCRIWRRLSLQIGTATIQIMRGSIRKTARRQLQRGTPGCATAGRTCGLQHRPRARQLGASTDARWGFSRSSGAGVSRRGLTSCDDYTQRRQRCQSRRGIVAPTTSGTRKALQARGGRAYVAVRHYRHPW